MAGYKYKLVREGFPFRTEIEYRGRVFLAYRIKALRDIPEQNVKAGDLGGYVTSAENLSQDGNCWIGEHGKALGNVFVVDNATIGKNAVVASGVENYNIHITDNVTITDNAQVSIRSEYITSNSPLDYMISGETNIFGEAQVYNVPYIYGNVDIFGNAKLYGTRHVAGTIDICSDVIVESGVKIAGRTRLTGNAYVHKNAVIVDSLLKDNDVLSEGQTLMKDILQKTAPKKTEAELLDNFLKGLSDGSSWKGLGSKKKSATPAQVEAGAAKPSKEDTAVANALNLLTEIKSDLHTYESDIVKLLKYPVMVDSTDSFTLDMMAALKRADRLALNPYHEDFVPAVYDVEKKFMAAEANAKKLSSTRLSEAEKKRTAKAQDLFRIAADEASSENEKELAFSQGFKQLEGIILVPEVAVDTFRVKIGLKELEPLPEDYYELYP